MSGTEGAASPFFSPDGHWIAFSNGRKLKKLALNGGTEVTLADAPSCCGGSWGEDGTILFSRGRSGLIRVSADGGEAREVTRLDAARGERDHRWPQHLPGGRAALFGIYSELAKHSAAVVDLQTGRWRVLLENASSPRYSSTGHMLFGRSGVLYAAPFDARRLELTGPAVPVLEHVAMWNSPGPTGSVAGNVYYALAPDGTLVFSPREARLPKRRLVWLDRQGRVTPLAARQETYVDVKLSPDGTRLAATLQTELDARTVLVLDIARDAWTRVAFEGEAAYRGPAVHSWMPDGKRLLLRAVSESQPHLLLVEADTAGPADKLLVGEAAFAVPTADGRAVLFCVQPAPAQWDIWRLQLEAPRKPQPFLATARTELLPSFSPDGRFVAHTSNESGRGEVYVRSYPGPGSGHPVSTQGGGTPRWSRDGREIFFVSQGALMSAAVRTSPSVSSDPPRKLFTLPEEIAVDFARFGDAAPDGQRFVMIQRDPAELRPLGLAIVPNWTAELQSRVAAGTNAGAAKR